MDKVNLNLLMEICIHIYLILVIKENLRMDREMEKEDMNKLMVNIMKDLL